MIIESDLQLLYLDVIDYHQLVRTHGHPYGQQILKSLYQFIIEKAEQYGPLVVEPLWDDAFMIIAPVNIDLYSWLNEFTRTFRKLPHGSGLDIAFHAGNSVIKSSTTPPLDLASKLFRALELAAQIAKSSLLPMDNHLYTDFMDILTHKKITAFYQPIIDLQSKLPHGYEALSRGPENSHFHMPGDLFSFGARAGQLFVLEQLCREKAIIHAPVSDQERLFLNINPQTLNDPGFVKGLTKQRVIKRGLNTSQVVFEITEHEAIIDYPTFRKTIEHYRNQGFQIAIDDTGAGYSGLLTLVELNPDYIKLDRGLIENIQNEPNKVAMVEAMVMVATKINAKVIAEGIETTEELEIVRSLGVDFGQGFLLGRPTPPVLPTSILN